MKFKVAVYRVFTGVIEVEAPTLRAAVDATKLNDSINLGDLLEGKYEPFRVDAVSTWTFEQPKEPRIGEEPIAYASRVDATDTGRPTNVRAYEPLVMPDLKLREPAKRGRPPKVSVVPSSSTKQIDESIASVPITDFSVEAHAKRLNKSVEDITRAIKEASDAFKIPFDDMSRTQDWIGLL
jgi:hypothetical protein